MIAVATQSFDLDKLPIGWFDIVLVAVLAFGVYLHGLAGDIAYEDSGGAPLLASDLIRAIPRAYQEFYAECGRD